MKLSNGAHPLMWHVRRTNPDDGLVPFVGHVVAETYFGHHPYVTWAACSDDGEMFSCAHGAYCMTVDEAMQNFHERVNA